jgi:valyl-tRNA synthetase
MPGTDHAGIATQTVVEKRLLLQEIDRHALGREKFIEKVQEWKDEYEATIIEQLKIMGCSCDYDRTRFTMDEVCAKAVREAFFRLFKDGLIYRGKRLVNWDPVSLTALADDEVEMEEVQGHMYYLRYPLYSDGDAHGLQSMGVVTVATTRPETMLGDTAVAMNPKDPRASQFVGKKIKLPIVDRIIPIIADDYVVRPPQFGGDENDAKAKIATGFLKVTPAHDDNDYQIGQRHPEIGMVNVFAPDASISDKHGWTDVSPEAKQFIGLSREECRKQIVKWFKDRGLLEDVKPYTHSVGHSYRSHVPIEPYLSDQWYVKVTDDRMRGEALRAMARDQDLAPGSPGETIDSSEVAGHAAPSPAKAGAKYDGASGGGGDGDLRFYPARYARTFQSWHENIRDWCISRQIWWGHRIPVWRHESPTSDCLEWLSILPKDDLHIIRSSDVTYVCLPDSTDRPGPSELIAKRLEIWGFVQDSDVLDTWFSSALWPISTMGWPTPGDFPQEIPEGDALINTFNPSTVLLTAREIITLWVSRMVMFNRYFRDGKLPFTDVYIHAMIQDGHGQKMSKSLGNGVDPRDIVHGHGADAMRFIMASIATQTQDVRLPVDMVCPHSGCGETFHPKEINSPAGYRVADAIQTCPKCKKQMVSGYGAATGIATPTNEMPLARNTSSKFDEGRNFANKVWNATRFALSNLNTTPANDAHRLQSVGVGDLSLVDRWILSRLHRTLHLIEDAIAEYRFKDYADAIYDFVWRDFCDWYLEAIKPTVKSNPAQQQVLRTVLNGIMRLLHPVMPFVTETLWPAISASGLAGVQDVILEPNVVLATAAWPDIKCSIDDPDADATMARVQNLVNAIRNRRSEHKVHERKEISIHAAAAIADLITSAGGVVETLAKIKNISPMGSNRPGGALPLAFEGSELLLSDLVDAVDAGAEKSRLTKLIAEKDKAVAGFKAKLSNEGYLSKAPPEKVEETRQLLAKAESELAAARSALESLS